MATQANATNDQAWHITQCPLLHSLKPEELAEVTKMSNVVSYGSKRIINLDNPGSRFVWIIKRGHLKMNYTDNDGRQAAVVLLNPGDIFGSLAPEGVASFGEHCTALTSTCLYRIARVDLEMLLRRYPDLSLRITQATFERVHRLQMRLAEIMMRPAEPRLAHALLELSRIAGKETDGGLMIDLPITHRDLAELIGTTREMVSYLMRKFRDAGLIDSARQQIVLCNIDGLREIHES